jgi:hypothetical protein
MKPFGADHIDWRDTSWTLYPRSDEKVTIEEVIEHLSVHKTHNISIEKITKHIIPGGVPDWEYNRIRVTAANLEYPIIIVQSENKYRYILDGNHRLQKAINEENENIKVKILDLDDPDTPEMFKKVFGSRHTDPTK